MNDSHIFFLSVEETSLDEDPEIHNSSVSTPSTEQLHPFAPPFLRLLTGRPFKLNVSKMALVAIFASGFSFAVLAHWRMPVTT